MAQADREALGAFNNATGGPTWEQNKNWNTDADLSEWHGIKTNDQGRVVGLSLVSNKLQGPIPKELGSLSEMKQLALGGNNLTGSIPLELGKLAALQELDLGWNQLSGPIPAELGQLRELEVLCLNDNQLTGHFPKELGALSELKKVWLFRNELTEQPSFRPQIAGGSLPPIEEESKMSMVPPPGRNRPQDDAKKTAKNNEENWQARLEPYNTISVIATLLAGFGLAIFPLPRCDVPDGNNFELGLAGHVAYNFLMCCSFSTNVLVAVILTLQLYFTRRLAMLQSSTMAADFMMTTQDIRHCAVRGFFFVSLPTFMMGFALLLLTVLEKVAAVCATVVIIVGLGLSVGSISFFVHKFRSPLVSERDVLAYAKCDGFVALKPLLRLPGAYLLVQRRERDRRKRRRDRRKDRNTAAFV